MNNILIPIIEVRRSLFTPCFYNNESDNNFYYRNGNDLKTISNTEKIVDYILLNKEEGSSTISDLMKYL